MTNDDKKVLATMLANLQEQMASLLIFLKNHSSEDGEAAIPAECPAKECIPRTREQSSNTWYV